jgi:hypothetical protein
VREHFSPRPDQGYEEPSAPDTTGVGQEVVDAAGFFAAVFLAAVFFAAVFFAAVFLAAVLAGAFFAGAAAFLAVRFVTGPRARRSASS